MKVVKLFAGESLALLGEDHYTHEQVVELARGAACSVALPDFRLACGPVVAVQLSGPVAVSSGPVAVRGFLMLPKVVDQLSDHFLTYRWCQCERSGESGLLCASVELAALNYLLARQDWEKLHIQKLTGQREGRQ